MTCCTLKLRHLQAAKNVMSTPLVTEIHRAKTLPWLIELFFFLIPDEAALESEGSWESVGKAMLVYFILVKNIGIRFLPFVLRLSLFFYPLFHHFASTRLFQIYFICMSFITLPIL